MEADGFIQPVHEDRVFTFRFADVEKLPPPVLSFDDVTFSYSGNAKDNLYEHLDLGIDMDSRTALVGPNGKHPPSIPIKIHLARALNFIYNFVASKTPY